MSSLSSASMVPHRRLLYASAGGGYHDEPVVDCFKPCFPNCNISFCPPGSPSLDSPSFPLPTVPGASPVNITFPLGDDGPHKDSGHLTLIALVVSSVLVTFFLLITYYLLLHRCRSYLRRRRSTSITTRALAATGPFLDDDPSPDAAAAADLVQDGIHHVWYIRTVGLDEPTIGSITVCVYRKDEGLIDGTDCSVCLGEFCEGEFVRLLPKCSHAFHIPCIDTWLRAHVNCPLCRAPIVCSPSASAATAAPRGNLDLPNSDAAVGAVDASSSSDEDHRHQQHQPLQTMPVVPEEEGVDADGPVIGIPVPSRPSSAVLDCGFRVQSDLGGYDGRQLGDDHWVTIELDADDHLLQPARRSVSMDSSAMGAHLRRVDLRGEDPTFGAEARRKEKENNPKGASPQKDPQGIGKCQSTNGGKFFLSRFTRGRSISVLPL